MFFTMIAFTYPSRGYYFHSSSKLMLQRLIWIWNGENLLTSSAKKNQCQSEVIQIGLTSGYVYNLIAGSHRMEATKTEAQLLGEFCSAQYDATVLPSLETYITIENQSRGYDKFWQTNELLDKAAAHIKKWVQEFGIKGLKTEIIKEKGLSPLIFTQIEGDLPVTLFFYGHYDKQPPFEGWREGLGPYKPVTQGGRLYGRGGADDGYSTYSTMVAIKACQQQGIKIPRCVMMTEGDEESGSDHMFQYIKLLKDRVGQPVLLFCLDSGTMDYEGFWLTNALRGLLVADYTIDILKDGVHSGTASGIVPSSFRIIRTMIERLENGKTGEIREEFQVNIPPLRYEELYNVAAELKQAAITPFPLVEGASNISTNPLAILINNGWKAQLATVGASGFTEAKEAGSVMRPRSTFRLSIRLPPTKSVEEAKVTLREILTTDVPYGAKATLEFSAAVNGWSAPAYSAVLSEVIDASVMEVFGRPKNALAEGGTIPLMGLFQELFPKAEFVVTGVLGPQSNAHGPNEFLDIPYVKKLTTCMAVILAKLSRHYEGEAQKK